MKINVYNKYNDNECQYVWSLISELDLVTTFCFLVF